VDDDRCGILLITVGAFIAMVQFKWGMIRTLAIAAGVGMVWFLVVRGGIV
jgi:hypothetical protein